MSWRVARSLDQLLMQLNVLAPRRSKVSDGSIGDAAHQAQGSASDHNPWFLLNGQPLVTARDFTHDPANGLDCSKLAAALIASRDPRIKYLIWQGRIVDSRPQFNPWTWQPSSGHYQHLHLSVMANASADDPRPWSLPGLTATEEDEMGLTPGENATVIEIRDNMRRVHDNLILGQRRGDRINQDLGYVRETILAEVGAVKAMAAATQAQVAAIAKNPDITPDQMSAVVDEAVARHTPTAEQVAAAQLPHIQAAVREVLGEDNAAQAAEIVRRLGERLAAD